MKKLLLLSVITLAFAQANAAPLLSNAGLTNTVTFNEVAVSVGQSVTNQFSGNGVTFSTSGPGSWYSSGNTGPYSNNSNFAGTYLDNFTGRSAASSYSIVFAGMVSAAGAWFEFNTSSPAATFTSYLGGVAQESFNYSNGNCCDSAEFVGFSGAFNEIRISQITGANFIMDNLAYTPGNDVPEPLTLALVGIALAGMRLTSRNAKKA